MTQLVTEKQSLDHVNDDKNLHQQELQREENVLSGVEPLPEVTKHYASQVPRLIGEIREAQKRSHERMWITSP
jgi:hypothetical protein